MKANIQFRFIKVIMRFVHLCDRQILLGGCRELHV